MAYDALDSEHLTSRPRLKWILIGIVTFHVPLLGFGIVLQATGWEPPPEAEIPSPPAMPAYELDSAAFLDHPRAEVMRIRKVFRSSDPMLSLEDCARIIEVERKLMKPGGQVSVRIPVTFEGTTEDETLCFDSLDGKGVQSSLAAILR